MTPPGGPGAGRSRPAILRRRPDATANYTQSHQGRGADYDEGFETLAMRALMWELEQQVLADLVGLVGRVGAGATPLRVLDLACGTGRITEVLARLLPTAEITGVDVADSMLAEARRRVPSARFVSADARRLELVGDGAPFDLVTAFRFFPNADADLAASVTASVADVVRPGGHLILNNHRNFWSSSYLARRVRGRDGAPGALNAQVVGPFTTRGFSMVARRSLGVLPHSDERPYLLPELSARLERFNARRLSHRHSGGADTIWMLRRDS